MCRSLNGVFVRVNGNRGLPRSRTWAFAEVGCDAVPAYLLHMEVWAFRDTFCLRASPLKEMTARGQHPGGLAILETKGRVEGYGCRILRNERDLRGEMWENGK